MKKFTAEIYAGHSDCAVIVPFDPAAVFETAPRRIGYRKHRGYAVRGTIEGHPFEGWIWFYFHQWRMVIPDPVLAAIDAGPGDEVQVAVRPHPESASVAPYQPGPRRGLT
jgi:hypothetical protein